jgi:hypothetical protein
MTTPIFQSALDRGLSIIPIPPREKGTKLDRWPERAVNDAAIMDGLPDHNYGVVANDEFCFLDIDNSEMFHNELGVKLPATYTVATSRGKHLYFRHTERSRKLGNKSAIGVFDFQADNKYVVGEGSTHPSGHVYTCIDPSPVIEIPDSLVAALDRHVSERKRERARLGLKAGDRQDMLNYAGSIYTTQITEDEMLEKLIERNEAESEEPLSMGDLQRMVQSAFKSWEHVTEAPKLIIGKPKLDTPVTVGTDFDFVLGPLQGEKHGVFALGALHLVQGSSGNGKTTIMLQMLKAQRGREKFFDRDSYGREYLIIWQDRSPAELRRQLDAMGMLEDPPPYTIADDTKPPADEINRAILSAKVKPQVVLVEGLDMWAEDAKDMKHVSTLATAVRTVAEHHHISLIATVGMPKMKAKEGYTAPRDRAFGSSAWARKADTVLDLTMDQETLVRHAQLLLRTGAAQKMEFRFEDGRLVPCGVALLNEKAQAVPSIREIMRTHKVGPCRATEIRAQLPVRAQSEGAREVRTQPG